MDGRWGPVPVRRAAPLTGAEKRITATLSVLPIGLALIVLLPVSAFTGSSVPEVFSAALVYGGMLGVAVGFVVVDRLQSRQCPRCQSRPDPDVEVCAWCGYDLEHRPRFACEERHGVYLDDDGPCPCGGMLRPLPTARGIGPEIVVMLKLGAGLLVALMAIGFVLQLLERSG